MASSDIYIENESNPSCIAVPILSDDKDIKFEKKIVRSCDNHAIEYTVDKFECSLCGMEITDIDMYVNHMILTEQCILFLSPSSTISNLLLPRFIRKNTLDDQKASFLGDDNIDNKTSYKILNDQILDNIDLKLKIEVDGILEKEAIKIEVGNGQRWKCRQCGISFSRKAAVSNHIKLNHSYSEKQESSAVNCLCENELKDINEKDKNIKQELDDSYSPVKHIISVKSDSLLEQKQFNHTSNEVAEYHVDDNIIPACNICGQIFKTMKILAGHKSIVHSQTRPFQCPYENCSFSFKTKGSLVRHERRHTGQRPFICSKCGRSFRESGSLSRHNKIGGLCKDKKDSQLPLYGKNLPFVPRYQEEKNKLDLSMKQEIGNNKMVWENYHNDSSLTKDELKLGKTCGSIRKFEEKIDLKSVKQEDNCINQSFDNYFDGQRRINLKIENRLEIFPFKVEELSAESMHQNRLEEEEVDGDLLHLSRELNGTMNLELSSPDDIADLDIKVPPDLLNIIQWSFICPVCGKSYAKKSTLSSHMNQHLDSIGNQCIKCDKTFIKQQALVRHLSSHSAYRQFICQCCNKAFKLMSHAQAHLRTHVTAKTIPCRHCGKLFKSVSSRNIHENSHSSERPFKCFHCIQSFLTKGSLIRHNRVHTNEAPFICTNCGRKFKEHGTLKRHLRNKVPCFENTQSAKENGECSIELQESKGIEDNINSCSEVSETVSMFINEND